MAGEVVLIDPFTGDSYKAGGGTGTAANQVQGTAAAGAAPAGNPVLVGFVRSTNTTMRSLQGDAIDVDAVQASALGPNVRSFSYAFNGTTWDRQRGDTNGTYAVATGSGAAAVAITPVVAANATSLVVKAAAGNFYGGSILAGATAGFLIAYNAAAAPASGAALTAAQVLGVVAVAANGSAALGEYSIPDRFSTGIVLLFSTSTSTYTVPANAASFIRGRAM